ncbi:MAG: carboxyl transferase domain-containing protein, partial [Woeseiaceae bacterium]
MPVLKSRVDTSSGEFQQNAAANVELAARLREVSAQIATGGPARSRERHLVRGKLLPRDRVDALTDDDSPFLEIGLLAAYGVYADEVPAAGLIAGIGRVQNTECMIVANDATVKGGT